MSEVADLVAGAAEARKNLAGLVIENADLFGAPITNMYFCCGSREKETHQTVPRGSGSSGVPVRSQMFLTNLPCLSNT
jgi:hypothetical protein